MGICQSQEEKDMENKTRQIDRDLMKQHLQQQKIVKLLLLGAGECGKSTILKQMRILHDHGFTEEEREKQKSAVYNNTVLAMATLLHGMAKLNIAFENQNLEPAARIVLDVVKRGEESEPLSEELARAIKTLWADRGVREKAFSRGQEFQLVENSKFFLDSVERIANSDYRPTEQDILLSRIKTTGIIEVKFKMKSVDFRVFDVGGQRSERKKWIHCFEDVNSIIFITAISEFDQVLFEDETTNRMIESMRLFESICNSRWFINTSMILFLNKTDLFIEKIARTSIKVCFNDYKDIWLSCPNIIEQQNIDKKYSSDVLLNERSNQILESPNSYDDQIKFIEEKFEGLNANPEKTIYIHQTCATDTNQIQLILDSVIDLIIQTNLQGCGLY